MLAGGAGWIGVGLDGVLAEHRGWEGAYPGIGPPVPRMVERVKGWLAQGKAVRVVPARVAPPYPFEEIERMRKAIESWCEEHVRQALPVTCAKNYGMLELWDDCAVWVERNTGRMAAEIVAEELRVSPRRDSGGS